MSCQMKSNYVFEVIMIKSVPRKSQSSLGSSRLPMTPRAVRTHNESPQLTLFLFTFILFLLSYVHSLHQRILARCWLQHISKNRLLSNRLCSIWVPIASAARIYSLWLFRYPAPLWFKRVHHCTHGWASQANQSAWISCGNRQWLEGMCEFVPKLRPEACNQSRSRSRSR